MRLTVKAVAEVRGLELGLGVTDVIDILSRLTPSDSAGRVRSSLSHEWLYVFKPRVSEIGRTPFLGGSLGATSRLLRWTCCYALSAICPGASTTSGTMQHDCVQ